MDNKYYIYNIPIGAIVIFVYLYSDWEYICKNGVSLIGFLFIFSGLLFPFSKFLIEKIALKYTKREFWNRGFFKDGVPKVKLEILYYIICLVFAIPFGIICIFLNIKRKG